MAKFPDAWMDELLLRNDIVSVVSEYTTLKEKGRRLWGLCPFHGEKTASFSVSPDKQLYYCFGCHAGGNVIQFIMGVERFSFSEAARHLAQRINLQMPDEIDDGAIQKERDVKERLYSACRDAAHYFHNTLLSEEGKAARDYFNRRGLSENTLTRFGLGYAIDSWDALLHYMKSKGYDAQELCAAGLAVNKAGTDRYYDSFRGRVIFPIIGGHQRVIGFGGRSLGNEMPKYINTPETPIFNKRLNLYGLNGLKGKNVDSLVVVEGYMDVVSLHQNGVINAVASLGTALTQQQARLIKRYAESVYIAYDGDAAGQNATLRGLDILSAEGLTVKVIEFPNGQDPDDFIRAEGIGGFEGRKDAAVSLNTFKLKKMAAKHDLMSEDGREAYALEGCQFIATLSPIEQERNYIALSRETGFSVSALKKQGDLAPVPSGEVRNRLSNYRNTRTTKQAQIPRERMAAERMLIKIALHDAARAREAASNENLFLYEPHQNFIAVLNDFYQKSAHIEMAAMFNALSTEDAEVAAGIIAAPDVELSEDCWVETLSALERMDCGESIKQLQEEAEKEETPIERRLICAKLIRELNEQLSSIQP